MTPPQPGPVAVTGSTGAVGGRVARLLAMHGADLVLPGRDVSRAPDLQGARPFHFLATSTLRPSRRASSASTRCSWSPVARARDRVVEHVSAVEAAVRAGVRHVVYLSFRGASPQCTFTFGRDHWRTEQHIRGSGLLPFLVGPDGVIRGPAGDGSLGAVARADVAAVAAAALRDPG